jgi:glycerol-3-phosphate dehydrogenase
MPVVSLNSSFIVQETQENRMDVNTIAVIGAGSMGRGSAYTSALGGYRTILEDVSDSILAKAVA